MDAGNDSIFGFDGMSADGPSKRLLSDFRTRLSRILSSEFDMLKTELYLMAYDYGVAEGLFGENSVICTGMKIVLEDATHESPVALSPTLLGKVEELGRRNGVLMHLMLAGDA